MFLAQSYSSFFNQCLIGTGNPNFLLYITEFGTTPSKALRKIYFVVPFAIVCSGNNSDAILNTSLSINGDRNCNPCAIDILSALIRISTLDHVCKSIYCILLTSG